MKINIRAANAVFLFLAAAATAHLFLPGSGINAPLSPGEAKTLLFARNYFTITFLKSLYDNSLPLYYLTAHFVSFLPGGVMALRIFSFALFLGACIAVFKTFRIRSGEDSEAHLINAAFLIMGTAPLLLRYSVKAEPFALSAFLISMSCMFFDSAFMARTGGGKRFTAAMTLALYTSGAAIAFFIALFSVSRMAGEEERPRATAAFKKIIIYFIPGAVFRLLGIIKDNYFFDSVFVNGKSAAVYFANYTAANLSALLPESNYESFSVAANIFTILILPLFVFLILKARYGAHRKRNTMLIPVIIASVLFGFASYKATTANAVADIGAAKLFEDLQGRIGKTDGMLFLDTCDNDDRRLFEYIFKEKEMPNLVVSSKKMRSRSIDLGPSFRKFEEQDSSSPYMADIKELFLVTDNVWQFRDKCTGAKKLKDMAPARKDFMNWAKNITNIAPLSEKEQDELFSVEKITFKPGFEKDGILLDLFVNDYGEAEKAARLIQDDTFTPEMLRSYFYTHDPKQSKNAAQKIIAACGGNMNCKETSIKKITTFAVEDRRIQDDVQSAILDIIGVDTTGRRSGGKL